MHLNLVKPVVFFDLETTGLSITKDRIIELCAIKIFPNGNELVREWLIDPTIPIPAESTLIHNITNDDIKDKPTFKEIAKELFNFIEDSDLAGYNSNKFDIPLLGEEFLRVNIKFNMKDRKAIDVQNIFHKMEKRTLAAAYKFYCNKELKNAHSALSDTKATYEILIQQISKYKDLKNDTEFLANFSEADLKYVDLAGFIRYNKKNERVLSFGKYKMITLENIWEENPGYFSWILNSDFPIFTKNIIKDFIRERKLINKFKK